MASIMETLVQSLGGGGLSKLSRSLGTDEKTTESALGAALPVLLGALSKNASDPRGAESLHRALAKDHDGSALDNIGALLDDPSSGPGAGILRHVLGGKQAAVESGIGRASGLDQGSVGKMLAAVAPMVLGALGRQQRQANLDAGGLAGLLGQERQQIEREQPQAMGLLGTMLDTDGDGDVDLGDLAKHGKGLLGKFLGGR
jgi:hypothetical protein